MYTPLQLPSEKVRDYTSLLHTYTRDTSETLQCQHYVNKYLSSCFALLRRKRAATKTSSASHKYKSTSKDLKPPDLWIHHERLEMKSIDKSPEPSVVMTETPIPRSTHESSSSEAAHQRQTTYRGTSHTICRTE